MLKFSIAGYYSHYHVNMAFLTLQKTHPEWMYENTIVDSVYGCLPGSIWGGCRIIKPNKYCDAQTTDIYDLRDNYYDLGVNLRHTYTNCELPQEAYYDFKNLQWTAACEHDGNSIIITDPKLKEFLHERFPKYNFIWSTSLCLHDINEINQKSKNDMLVLDYGFNMKPHLLGQLLYPENLEIMLSEACSDECPYRKLHYKIESQYILNQEQHRNITLQCYKPETRDFLTFYDCLNKLKSCLTHEQVLELNQQFGITHFKIAGRDYNNINYIESLVYYLIKPEYRDQARSLLLLEAYEELQ